MKEFKIEVLNENDKNIAEFMNTSYKYLYDIKNPTTGKYLYRDISDIDYLERLIKKIESVNREYEVIEHRIYPRYSESFDLLLPVINKIEGDYNFSFSLYSIGNEYKCKLIDNDYSFGFICNRSENMIESVILSVLEFINSSSQIKKNYDFVVPYYEG